jgi:hypothetical protein
MNITELQELCGTQSASKGFHRDRPADNPQQLAHWQGNRLMLIVSEAAEAQEEIRLGKAANETYYPGEHRYIQSGSGFCAVCDEVEHKPSKPEGVPSEIADIVIRCLDFAYTEGFDLESIIEEKLAYNRSREYMHEKNF